jgi:CheY-like chemotaxis protein
MVLNSTLNTAKILIVDDDLDTLKLVGLILQRQGYEIAAANSGMQSAQPGQDVVINGTGLGAITSDETQSGVTDVPATAIQVYVGVKPAAVVSVALHTLTSRHPTPGTVRPQ